MALWETLLLSKCKFIKCSECYHIVYTAVVKRLSSFIASFKNQQHNKVQPALNSCCGKYELWNGSHYFFLTAFWGRSIMFHLVCILHLQVHRYFTINVYKKGCRILRNLPEKCVSIKFLPNLVPYIPVKNYQT